MTGAVLVTGGAGFIGRRLVRALLDRGARVTVLDALVESVHGPDADPPAELDGARFLRGDVREAADLRAALEGAELVYHLAAETGTGESMYRARHYVDVNVGGTALLCDLIGAAERPPRRVVLASSRAVYGEGPYRCPAHGIVHPAPRSRERLVAGCWDPQCPTCGMTLDAHPAGPGTPSRPVSVYGLTKRDQEELLLELLPPRGVDVIALRLQNVYGPGQSLRNPYTGILSIFSVRLLAGSGLNVFEDGRESRDFVHVNDVVEAFLRAGEADLTPDAHVLDVGTGRPTSVLEVAWVRGAERTASRLDDALDEMRAAGLLGRAETR